MKKKEVKQRETGKGERRKKRKKRGKKGKNSIQQVACLINRLLAFGRLGLHLLIREAGTDENVSLEHFVVLNAAPLELNNCLCDCSEVRAVTEWMRCWYL